MTKISRWKKWLIIAVGSIAAAALLAAIAGILWFHRAVTTSQNVYFAFQATDRGKSLAEEFSKTIREMKLDGTLRQILDVSQEWVDSLPE